MKIEFALIPNHALKADIHLVYLATAGNVCKYDFVIMPDVVCLLYSWYEYSNLARMIMYHCYRAQTTCFLIIF